MPCSIEHGTLIIRKKDPSLEEQPMFGSPRRARCNVLGHLLAERHIEHGSSAVGDDSYRLFPMPPCSTWHPWRSGPEPDVSDRKADVCDENGHAKPAKR